MYGRRTVQGMLVSRGGHLHVSERRIGDSLRRVAPLYHQATQQNTAMRTNAVPYSSDYPRHKLQVDQNEKLAGYGVTHVAAIDGYSGMILGFVTMSVKNPSVIYNSLYRCVCMDGQRFFLYSIYYICCRTIVSQFGLLDLIRVDHGRE